MARVNLSKGRIEKTIALLSLESPAPIAKQGPKWQLTAANLSEAFWQRAERLTELRRDEQRQMQDYVSLEPGHMEFLIRALDGDPGTIRPPALPPLPKRPTRLWCERPWRFFAEPACRLSRASNGRRVGCRSIVSADELPPTFKHSLARRSASGGMPDGAAWYARASTGTGALPMNLWKPVCGWCASGIRNPRPPG